MTPDAKRTVRGRVVRGALAVVCVQAVAVGVYLWVERSRSGDASRSFAVEELAGQVALDCVLQTAQGDVRRLRQARGKTVLLHFWATWCAPCKAELPQLLALGEELAGEGGFELVAVAVNDDWSSVRRFFADRVPGAIHRDASGEAARAFEVSALPDSYLLDPSGTPVARFAGTREWNSELAHETIRRLITNRRRTVPRP